MILADKITEERKKSGWSQEELAMRLGVSRQAVSKWESAGSVPDLQRILQLAELFGVSTDYLLKDEMTAERFSEGAEPSYMTGSFADTYTETEPLRRVSMEEARGYLDMKQHEGPIIANAVSMCIISPCLLILLGTLAESGLYNISEALGFGIGFVFLFGMIATAVYMFITSGMRLGRSEDLEKVNFETEYGVSGMVKEKRNTFEGIFARGIALGVVLCIVAVVPLVLAGLSEAPDHIAGAFTSLMLVLIAVGVNMIIRVSMIRGSYDVLLQEGEYSGKEKHMNSKLEPFRQIYWSLATAIYLGWSFWTMRWDMTWIIWPVAGVLYGCVYGVMRVITGTRK